MDFHQGATLFLSFVAALLAALAYFNTRERFRLDLFEKRWPIYEGVVRICSIVQAFGGVPIPARYQGDRDEFRVERSRELADLLNENLRGLGYHKSKSLFGPELTYELNKLHNHLVWMEVFEVGQHNADEWGRRMMEISELAYRLPTLFEPYTYFGNYKAPLPGPLNRAFRLDRLPN